MCMFLQLYALVSNIFLYLCGVITFKSMLSLKEIFELPTNGAKITELEKKTVEVPEWGVLLHDYEPTKHAIVADQMGRKDRQRKDGVVEKASRIYIGLEKLLSHRYNEYTFSIPVKRVYSNISDNATRSDIAKAIELIYKHARIDAVNLKRGLAYYAACEVFTIWYVVPKKNTLYGFDCDYKLKCKTYSPMEGYELYPLIDEMDDMLAMSFKYEKKDGNKVNTFFETFTEDRHYVWKQDGNSVDGWTEILAEPIEILKIPGAYIFRNAPVYHGLSKIREEIEYTLSRHSDVIAYNSAPVLKITGNLIGDEAKGESRRAYRLENGGDVSYVSWNQSVEALKYQVDMMIKLFFMQAQMPDISFDNLKGLGSIGYDARQTLFTDSHLKIGDESGAWVEFLERECNVIKAFLKKMKAAWENEIDNVDVEHIITPFVQNDEKYEIEKWMKANGDKPLIGHLESIRKAGVSEDPEETYKEYEEEQQASLESRVNDVFGGGSAA